ncbi:hypothetical protein DOTSEDRAFT_79959 [Dothistroma septosporum NZE10]|uniref:Protein ROT1 n=1 Tax=Dothistroma septosporum (strain NZE10 / CBS 128990) TaxID=675120 RepID=N1PM53_DOTSN|nr:hypothetical protein DOTSEDRAFT_79959 [Dothistroma septosporum NZE10]
MLLYHSLAAGLSLVSFSNAQAALGGAGAGAAAASITPAAAATAAANPGTGSIIGTWSTKSNKTLTGPGFYNPVEDKMIEPERTGFSYSFTDDGFYEEAYYRAIANPQNPSCPAGIMQWQHGTYEKNDNGSITLTPISVDGRQLMSKPCDYDNGIYTRYNQTELFKSWEVLTDPYHNIPRLNLFKFDGSPMAPMYLAMSPPQMLPTTTLNPTTSSTGGAKSTNKAKRSLEYEVPLNWKPQLFEANHSDVVHRINAERLWWVGLTFTGVGGLLYFGPRRLGLRL